MRMTGGEALARQLALEGVRQTFGVPGVQLDYATDGIAQLDEIHYLTPRHEQATSYMADGYARGSGEVGVYMVVPGPGVLNATAGLATALACSSPVVCIAGQIPSRAIGRGLGLLHEIPQQSQILGALTKWSGMARTPEGVPGIIRQAFHQARSGRPRPVAVEVPPDVLKAQGDMQLVKPVEPELVEPDGLLLRQAAELLRDAERPVLYAGWGVQAANATQELRLLAETLQSPVVMSPNGRGALSDHHHLALNSISGRRALADADAVLAVGTRLITQERATPVQMASHAALILLNADADDLGPPRKARLGIHGDARLGLAGLLEHLDGLSPRPARQAAMDALRRWGDEQIAELEPQRSWLRALRQAIPEDGILVSEVTQMGYLARVDYPVYVPRTLLGPGYQGTLGYGFPTALGVKVANPDRAVVSINGDGGFGWNLQELATAAKYDIGLVTVVFNDRAFGNVRRIQAQAFDGRFIGTDLHNPDFVVLAGAFGVPASVATTPDELSAVLTEALSGTTPYLIEVPVGELPDPWPILLELPPARS